MKAIQLALLEIRRFRGPVRRFVPLALVLAPLLYGGLYLWSNWDPYGKLSEVPVAVVNSDRPVENAGQHINAGEQFTRQLQTSDMFDWHFTNPQEARNGLKEGRYYLTIEVPPEFSAKLATPANSSPQRAAVLITKNDANGYLAGVMADTTKAELQNQINAAAHAAYARSLFGEMGGIRDKLRESSDMSAQLVEGTELSKQSANGFVTGLAGTRDGANQVSLGVRQVSDASAALDAQLAGVNEFASKNLPEAVNGLVNTTNAAADGLRAVKDGTAFVKNHAADSAASVGDLGRRFPGIRQDPAYIRALDNAQSSSAAATSTDRAAAKALASAQDANGRALALQQGMAPVQEQFRAVKAPADAMRTGAAQLGAGSQGLLNGLNALTSNSKAMQTGTVQLNDRAHRLERMIRESTAKVPPNTPAQIGQAADALGSPSEIKTKNLNPANVYGRGLAPLFFAIALWAFALLAYLLIKPVNARALATRTSAATIAVGGWLPGAWLGMLGGLVLFTAVNFGLGLDPLHSAWTVGLLSLAAATFVAIHHFLRAWLGPVGDIVSVLLLVLQLAASGGLYPIETAPGPFRAIHPYMPMTSVVEGLRVTISGGLTDHLLHCVTVLGTFLVAFLLLTTFVVMRKRTWSVGRLHPQIDW